MSRGGRRPGAGRPKVESYCLQVRASGELLEAIDRAREEGESRNAAAKRILLDALTAPPAPTPTPLPE